MFHLISIKKINTSSQFTVVTVYSLHYSHFPFLYQALYQSWVLDACRNILAILEDLPSLRPPIDHMCELLPRLQARYYSIASSSKVHIYYLCLLSFIILCVCVCACVRVAKQRPLVTGSPQQHPHLRRGG